MPKYVDEEGNEFELSVPLDQLQADAKAKAEIETQLQQTKERLAGMENKDMNWQKLRNMTDDEKKALSAKEMELMKRQEALEENQRSWEARQIESNKREALRQSGIHDTDVEARVLANYERIKDEAKTPEEVAAKMRDAINMTSGAVARPNPMYSSMGLGSSPGAPAQKSEVSGELGSLASKFGITAEDIKKHTK